MYPSSESDYIMYVKPKLLTKSGSFHYISLVVNPMLTLDKSRKSQFFQKMMMKQGPLMFGIMYPNSRIKAWIH